MTVEIRSDNPLLLPVLFRGAENGKYQSDAGARSSTYPGFTCTVCVLNSESGFQHTMNPDTVLSLEGGFVALASLAA